MTAWEIVGLVLGILGAQAVFWFFFALWLRRRNARASEALRQEVGSTGETVERGPERGLYAGSTGGFPKVQGNGVVLLSDRRVLFQKAIGARVEVPLAEVSAVREDKWFAGRYRSGREHVILQTPHGEVGFIVRDHAAWMTALRAAIAAKA